MQVTVVYIAKGVQFIQEIEVAPGSTVQQSIEQSELLLKHPDVSLEENQVGIFGSIVSLNEEVKPDDRVEIYRPLTMNPMEARRLRAKVKL